MFTFVSVSEWVESRLRYARRNPKSAHIFESQAYGVAQFVCEQCYNTNPELVQKIEKMWDDVWQPDFWGCEE